MQLLVTGHGTGRRHSMHEDQPAWPSSTKCFWLYRNFAVSSDLEVLIYLRLPLDEHITYFIYKKNSSLPPSLYVSRVLFAGISPLVRFLCPQ